MTRHVAWYTLTASKKRLAAQSGWQISGEVVKLVAQASGESRNHLVPFVDPTPGLQVVEPAPMPPDATPPTTWVSAGQLRAWTRLEAADAAFKACNVLAEEYIENTFGTWYKNYSAGLIHGPTGLQGDPDAAPPQPPKGAMAQLSITGMWFDLIQTGPPVCRVPPYTKIPPPQAATGHGGDALGTLQGELGQGAAPSPFTKATPVTGQKTAPDGSVWVRIL